MWHILTAEIVYNKRFMLMGYGLFFILTAIVLLFGKPLHFFRDFSIALWASVLFTQFAGEFEKIRSKRVRSLAVVPTSSRRVALVRIVHTLLYWLSLIVLFILVVTIFAASNLKVEFFLTLIQVNALIWIAFAACTIFYDLKNSTFDSKKRFWLRFIWTAVIIVSYYVLFYYMNFMGLFTDSIIIDRTVLKSGYFSSAGIVGLNLLALLLVGFSIEIYVHRRAYLE